MPTYEYKCTGCEEVFEFFQKITDPPIKECPVCGKPLKRLISGGIGVIFKGSGFYTTDYKNSSINTRSVKTGNEKNGLKKEEKTGTESKKSD